jgi:hypothetical protein
MNRTDITPWVKAKASQGNNACVEMRRNGQSIEVRDSKTGDTGPILSFSSTEIRAWLDGVAKSEFDHLL